ncbi:MAG TPA: DNRLRE domain-containing protein [Candidatus Methylacidiphilales bacterium]
MKSLLGPSRSIFALFCLCAVSLFATTNSWASLSGTGTVSVARVSSGQSTLFTVAVTPAANSTGISVSADLSTFGLSKTTQLYDDGTHGDVTAGDNTYSLSVTVPANQAGGSVTVPVTIGDAQGDTASTSVSFAVLGNFTIFHTNDSHARITPHQWIVPQHGTQPFAFEAVGGAAYQTAEVLSLTAGNVNSLVLDGGDISEGNPVGDFSGVDSTPSNAGVVGYYQLLSQKLKTQRGRGIDAFVVGNHDVRYAAYINNLANQTDFPVISINVCKHGTTTPYFQPYVTVTVNGTKIGIIGYTTESSTVGPDLANTIDIVKCDWSSTNSAFVHLADTVNTLRNTLGCDVVILLTHDGHSDLCTPSSSKINGPVLADTTAAKIPEIAITGHWHTWCEDVWQPSILNYKTIFMESSSFIQYVGELNVTGSGAYLSSAQHVLTNSTITPDPDVANYVQNEKNLYNSIQPLGYQADQILGYTAQDLVLDKKMKWWSADEYPWTGDNSAGGFICDGLKWKATQMFGGCDLSIEVGGGVRSDIAAGAMTFTNIYEMFPWSDDLLYEINMTGQEIWNFIQSNNCDAGISREWHVTAVDGIISAITYNGNPIDLNATYKVSINSYIYQNNTFSDTNPQTSTYLCRQALVDYAQQWPQSNPYQVGGSRYDLNTDYAGGYTAVVTMMNDNDSATTFDDGFIRMLSATPETLGRVGSAQVPSSLVNPDGTINHANRLSESEWYRSYLGFKTGALHNGDIVQIYGKGGFYDGDPEFVDSEGIQSNGVEFNIIGHDATLSQPEYYSSINQFFNNTYKNHYVKFYAKKTGTSTVVDSANTSLSVSDVTAYNAKTLPGNVGDLLQLTGVTTSETSGNSLRFRCDSVVEASSVGVTGFPPSSQVTTIPTGTQSGPIQLTAMASGAPVSTVNTVSLTPIADAEIASGHATTNYGSSTSIYIQSAASGYGNERGWLKFDLSSLPANANITGARLVMYNWKDTGASLPSSAYPGNSDTWTETGLTWNNQPAFGSALSTVTLASGSYDLDYTWDVTSFAQSKFASYASGATSKPISILVKAVTEGSTDPTSPSYAFDSKEYGGSSIPVLQVDTPSTAAAPSIAQVQYYYRYSSDGTTYGAWTAYQISTTGPNYAVTFNYPGGAGYYQFYSVATDSNGVTEPTPALYDTSASYNVATQGTALDTDTPTMPQWGLIALGVLLFGFAASQLRTRLHLFLFLVVVGLSFLFLVVPRLNASTGFVQKQKMARLL